MDDGWSRLVNSQALASDDEESRKSQLIFKLYKLGNIYSLRQGKQPQSQLQNPAG
jgi:hypothetical protein